MGNSNWVVCPICQNKTRVKVLPETVLQKFSLYCPKCKRESLINIRDLKTTVIKEPDATTQSR